MTAIGVLCARVRVEEKRIVAALAEAGVPATIVPPASAPLPPGPAPADLAALGGDETPIASVVIDRCQNRHIAAATLPLLRAGGVDVIDAGIAATGSRLDIATALARAGLSRPATLIAFSEGSAIAATLRIGFPATLLPQTPGSVTTGLLDHDTAEAVIEHRVVLGSYPEAVVVLQAGYPQAGDLGRHHVVGEEVVAVEGALTDAVAQRLAAAAARAVSAGAVAVDIARVAGELVVWDLLPVADTRDADQVGPRSVGEALRDLALARAACQAQPGGGANEPVHRAWEVQVSRDVVGISLTA